MEFQNVGKLSICANSVYQVLFLLPVESLGTSHRVSDIDTICKHFNVTVKPDTLMVEWMMS